MGDVTTAASVEEGDDGTAAVPSPLLVPVESDGMRAWAEVLVDRARSEGVALTGEDGLLTSMVREVLQSGLDVEMADHLGYEPYESIGRGSANSRNGAYPKTVRTDVGPVELRMPRDRQGTFEPVTVPKHVRRLDGLGANVISLYAKGLTTGEIQAHLAEIYDTEVSRETISKITDQVLPDMVAWQSRPLDRRIIDTSKETYYEALGQSTAGWHEGEHDLRPWTDYFLGILIAAYKEFESRTGAIGGRGSKKALITTFIDSLMIPEFTITDVRQAAPGVSDGYINRLLGEIKKAGRIESLGTGRGARWRRLGGD
jgi:hypothetical protein